MTRPVAVLSALLYVAACSAPLTQRGPVRPGRAPPGSEVEKSCAETESAAARDDRIDFGWLAPLVSSVELPLTQSFVRVYEAPTVTVTRKEVLLDGVRVGGLDGSESLRRQLELDRALKGLRTAWHASHGQEPFPGVVNVAIDRRVASVVAKAVVLSAAFAGFPNAYLIARRSEQHLDFASIYVSGRVAGLREQGTLHRAPDFRIAWDGNQAELGWNSRGFSRSVALSELASAVAAEWHATGVHRDPSDRELDRAALGVSDRIPFGVTFGQLEAIGQEQRRFTLESGEPMCLPVFDVTFEIAPAELAQFLGQ